MNRLSLLHHRVARMLIVVMLLAGLRLAFPPTPAAAIVPTLTQIVAGAGHTCGLTNTGAVLCWGGNTLGAIGDGSRVHRPTPVLVNGLDRDVTAIGTGSEHMCAVQNGMVYCWGRNWENQVTLGRHDFWTEPSFTFGFEEKVVAVDGGGYHSCVLTSAGEVFCWGWNLYGQLGDGNWGWEIGSGYFAQVVGLTNATDIAVGTHHSCAIHSGGAVSCWGSNGDGQLGNSTREDSPAPMMVEGLHRGVRAITAGDQHTCALKDNGVVVCWGENHDGRLGDGTTTRQLTPMPVSGLDGEVTAIGAGNDHTCALKRSGALLCWGANGNGQLGDGTLENRSLPTAVLGLGPVQTMGLGNGHTCAVEITGALACWGANDMGQVGSGGAGNRGTPALVAGLDRGVVGVSAGSEHSCAVRAEGTVVCWGANTDGQLGDGTTQLRRVPVAVYGLTAQVIALDAGERHTCALNALGDVYCWGRNDYGQLGDGTTHTRLTPVRVQGLDERIVTISVNDTHTCALSITGAVFCWGDNTYGQLGDGTTTTRLSPVAVDELGAAASAIATGSTHTCAVGTGAAFCWGRNDHGQLGDGTTEDRLTPVAVNGLDAGVAALAAGFAHTCALRTDGALACWGYNGIGQVGDNTRSDRFTPIAVVGLSEGVVAVDLSRLHTCALDTSRSVFCWGSNDGQLGDDTRQERLIPGIVNGLDNNVAAITAGLRHTCALSTRGSVLCWGRNTANQLGDGSILVHTTPATVMLPEINSAPSISTIPNRWTAPGTPLGPIGLVIHDAENPNTLTVRAESSNLELVPVDAIVFAGEGVHQTVTITPVAGITGTTTITITVSDGALESYIRFMLTVSPTPPPLYLPMVTV